MSDSHVGSLTTAFEAMDSAALEGNVVEVDTAHRQFHTLLISGAGERFAAVSSHLWDHTIRYRDAAVTSATNAAEVFLDAQFEHGQILAAVAAADGDSAAAALARHYERTARTLIAAADPTHSTVLLDGALEAVLGGGGRR